MKTSVPCTSTTVLPPLALAPFADERDERRERGRRLAPAWIIQKRPWKWRAPVVEDADQRTGFHGLADMTLEREPEAQSVMHRPERQAEMGRDQSRRRPTS